VPEQEEPVQPEDTPAFVEVDDDDYCGYYGGGWVDTDNEEEPMELPEDHPDAVEGSKEEDAAGGDTADSDAAGGDDAKDFVTMTQMMIQSQPTQQTNHHQSPIMRNKYITWTLLKVHSQHFSGGPCRESASH
jgi:hypothetical protein